ncbi:DUF4349 domain-containing protein [Cesiribacter sp. SM1]|uniref:DUF4349 domain-containing protein n=1 Tax=Cesiribacter sp. SM1 TaxID=2861196 RepID=UPI001CD39B1E|nr:DUF4349 domain-containing protein [Cesiribacter sp. SM1]
MKKLPLLLLLFFAACEADNSRSTRDNYAGDEFEETADVDMNIPFSAQPPSPADYKMHRRSGDMDYAAVEMVAVPGGPSAYTNVSQPLPAPFDTVAKQIIKTASLVYEVKALQEANHKVDSLVKKTGGYISSSNQNNSQQRHELNLTLRVPSRYFDALMNALGTLPERVDHKSVEAQDVTEQYVDLRSRLQTKKKVEKRYQELLQKANTVKEILEVEEKLRQLQEEIEAKEGQLRYLSHQVGYSTIHLNLYQVQKYEYLPSRTPNFGQRILGALDGGWQLLLGLLLFIFRLWPLWVIGGIIALAVIRYRKQHKRKSLAKD